ncbi:MAG: Tfp pilus assembly protein FimT/FimU [Thermodesulfovibrionales bacterium]
MLILRTGIYNKDRISGFTLLELIVVIFIVSLFMAIAVPSFTGIESNEIRSEVKRIASILRYLNDTAIAKKEELYLTVDFKDNSIIYSTVEGEKRERIEYLRSIFLETKGEINSGEVKVIFTPLGAGEFMRFYLAVNKKVFSIELNPLSGRVRIKEGISEMGDFSSERTRCEGVNG